MFTTQPEVIVCTSEHTWEDESPSGTTTQFLMSLVKFLLSICRDPSSPFKAFSCLQSKRGVFIFGDLATGMKHIVLSGQVYISTNRFCMKVR